MMPKGQTVRTILNAGFLLAVIISLFLFLNSSAKAGSAASALPDFTDFSKPIQNGKEGMLRGVYVEDALALPVVQQPEGNTNFVSSREGEATQFSLASQFGNVGLLAHNYLSGKLFSRLTIGQDVRLVYGDVKIEYFTVTMLLRYQALQPASPYSSFRNLKNKDEILSAEQMFQRIYRGDHHVTFQTCIAANGNPSWGRLFVVAVPKLQHMSINRLTVQLPQ